MERTIRSRVDRRIRTILPTRWTRLLAVVALTSLVVTVLTGIYLALFFDPSMARVTYRGPVAYLRGSPTSRAYASVLDICFTVRGGLFIRQLHNWSASLFIASLIAILVSAFFTGAFCRPRRPIWVATVALLLVGMLEAYTGILLLDDGMSGTSLRMVSAYLLTIPVVGTRLHWALFGGEFPGTAVIPRLYLAHLALLPAAIVAIVALVARRAASVRLSVTYAARAAGVVALTAAVLAFMAGVFQVNPIWLYGPADPAIVSAGSTAPWYFGWVDGAVRLWPGLDIHLFRHTIPAPFWPAMVLLPATFVLAAVYPWIERRLTRDDSSDDLSQRSRDVPARTAFGAGAATFYLCLQFAGGIDVIAATFHLSADILFWVARIGVFTLPPLAAWSAHRLCLGLRLRDRAVLEHGIETGIIHRLPTGGYVEVRQPLSDVDGRPRLNHSAADTEAS